MLRRVYQRLLVRRPTPLRFSPAVLPIHPAVRTIAWSERDRQVTPPPPRWPPGRRLARSWERARERAVALAPNSALSLVPSATAARRRRGRREAESAAVTHRGYHRQKGRGARGARGQGRCGFRRRRDAMALGAAGAASASSRVRAPWCGKGAPGPTVAESSQLVYPLTTGFHGCYQHDCGGDHSLRAQDRPRMVRRLASSRRQLHDAPPRKDCDGG